MTEQTITATPVNAPDILRNAPLGRQVDINLETNILEPVSHSFNTATGGRTVFVLPAKGVLDSGNAAITFELTNPTEADFATTILKIVLRTASHLPKSQPVVLSYSSNSCSILNSTKAHHSVGRTSATHRTLTQPKDLYA